MHVFPRSFWDIHDFHDSFIRWKCLIYDVINVGSIDSPYRWCIRIIFLQWRRILIWVSWSILIAWFDISIAENCVLLLVSSSMFECISFPLLVWTWMYATIVPSDKVEPIIVLDLVTTVNGKWTSYVIVKTGAVSRVDIGGGIVKVPMREESLNIPTPTSWITTFEFFTKGTFEWILVFRCAVI